MDEQIAAEIADEYLTRWRRLALYAELAVMEENEDKDWENVVGRDGNEYEVLNYVLRDAGERLRMVVAVSGRRRRATTVTLTSELIIRSDGTYVE
ncbi:hypothetical protein [Nonomuraea longicatena]|uniref:Uncharacterized protein n=1 Tax=Nonomuraea longicatena TaxID=83682 RepID=A0ABN1R6N7_9ACTN